MEFLAALTFLSQGAGDPDDAALWKRYAEGGEGEAFETLYHRHRRWVYMICYRYCRNANGAAELTQAVFARCLEKASIFDGSNFRGWLKVMAVNVCLDQIRKEKRQHRGEPVGSPQEYSDAPTPEDLVARQQLRHKIAGVLAELPVKQKRVVVMKYLFDLSYEEIKSKTGFSDQEVKSYLQNGRRNFEIVWGRVPNL